MSTYEIPAEASQLGDWALADKSSPYNCPLQASEDFSGPIPTRKCTDLPCLCLFVFVSAGYAALATYDPDRLTHGYDFRGELCGIGGLDSKAYTYFLAPLDSTKLRMCLEGCPVIEVRNAACLYNPDHYTEIENVTCYDAYASKPFTNKYCLPAEEAKREAVLEWMLEVDQNSTWVLGDMYRVSFTQAWDVLAIGGAVAIAVTLFLLLAFKAGYCLSPLSIAAVLVVSLLFCAMSFLVYEEQNRVKDRVCSSFGPVYMENCSEGAYAYFGLCWAVAGVGGLVLLVLICFGRVMARWGLALQLARMPGKDLPWLQFAAVLALVVAGGGYALFLTVIAYTASCGEISRTDEELVPGGEVAELTFSLPERILLGYEVAVMLWWYSCLGLIVEFVAAASTAHWYFSKDKAFVQQPVWKSLGMMCRYHLGSVVFAACIIPLLRPLKYFCDLIRSCFHSPQSGCSRCLLSTCGCCVECDLILFRFLSSEGLAFQALWGGSLGEACRKAYFLRKRCKQVVDLRYFAGNLVVWVWQLIVIMSSPVFVAFWIEHNSDTFQRDPTMHITSVTGMSVMALVASWACAQVLAGYIRGCLHGIIVCYESDYEMFRSTERFGVYDILLLFEEDILDLGEKSLDKDSSTPDSRSNAHTQKQSLERTPRRQAFVEIDSRVPRDSAVKAVEQPTHSTPGQILEDVPEPMARPSTKPDPHLPRVSKKAGRRK